VREKPLALEIQRELDKNTDSFQQKAPTIPLSVKVFKVHNYVIMLPIKVSRVRFQRLRKANCKSMIGIEQPWKAGTLQEARFRKYRYHFPIL